MKANADKCHLLVSSDEVCTAKIEDFTIENSTEEKLLGIKFDSNLSFEGHVTSLCKKASQKLHALGRISHYMDLNKRRSLVKAFITLLLPRNVGFLENFAYVQNEWSLLIASTYLYWTFEFISFNSFITEGPMI